jgi:hypothetical protein
MMEGSITTRDSCFSIHSSMKSDKTRRNVTLAAMGGSWRSRSCELADTCAGDRDAQSHCRCGKGRGARPLPASTVCEVGHSG